MLDRPVILSRKQRAAALADALHGIGDPALVEATKRRHIVAEKIVALGRRRRYAMSVQQKLDLSLGSYVRRVYTEWSPNLSEKERKKHNAEAARLIAAAKKGDGVDDLVTLVAANEASRAVYDKIRKTTEKEMTKLAKQLPAAQWVESIHGAGLLGLASIVAETGTLDGYAGPAKLWSRLGFAPFEGAALSTYRREKWRPRALTKEEWIEHPFSAQRYAFMAMLAKPLRDHQWIGAAKTEDGKGRPNGYYGELYAARREACEVSHPDWTDAHRDRDALRVTFKRFLADLWEAWIDQSFVLGQSSTDAQSICAESESAAVGQSTIATQSSGADGGHPIQSSA